MLFEYIADTDSHIDGMLRNLKIQIVSKQRVKLDAKHSAFGEQSSVAFHDSEEIFGSLHSCEHHSLTNHCSNLCTTNIEHIAMLGEEWQVVVACLRHQSVAQSCSVDKQTQIIFPACGVQILKLSPCVYHSKLSRH